MPPPRRQTPTPQKRRPTQTPWPRLGLQLVRQQAPRGRTFGLKCNDFVIMMQFCDAESACRKASSLLIECLKFCDAESAFRRASSLLIDCLKFCDVETAFRKAVLRCRICLQKGVQPFD
eukprot:13519280-Alexandrium_andersonii.AAC.1